MADVETNEVSQESATKSLLKKKTTKVKEATSPVEDLLVVNAQQIENLTKDDALSMVHTLLEQEGINDFKLGGVLRHIRKNGWYDGYENFDAMVENVYGIKKRKAAYLVAIYESLVENQIPWEKVATLGWTKLRLIADLLNAENVDDWVAKAKSLTTIQLEEVVKQYKASLAGGGEAETSNEVTSTVSTLTLKVHEDQKVTIREAIDKAKAEVGSEFDTVALESICLGYLGGSVNINKTGTMPTLQDLMKEATYEDVLQVFEMVFPDVDLTVNV